MSQLPFGLGTIWDVEVEVKVDADAESQLPFGLGTIWDAVIAELKGKMKWSQLPFGLGTIWDIHGYLVVKSKTEESQLPFGLGTIWDGVPDVGPVPRLPGVSIAFRLGNDLGLYPFFSRFASGIFGRFCLTGVYQGQRGIDLNENPVRIFDEKRF